MEMGIKHIGLIGLAGSGKDTAAEALGEFGYWKAAFANHLKQLAYEFGWDGQKLLDWLRQMYVDVPVAVPGADPSHAFFAEGQRTVVREIIARIQQARNL